MQRVLEGKMSVLKSDRSKRASPKCQTELRIQKTRKIMITKKTIYICANRKLMTKCINNNQWHFPNLHGTLHISEVLGKYIYYIHKSVYK